MITERSKSVIPFRPADAASVGEGCLLPRHDRLAQRRPRDDGRPGRFQLRLLRQRIRRPDDRRPHDLRALHDDPHGQPRDGPGRPDPGPGLDVAGTSRSAPTAGSGWASASSPASRSATAASIGAGSVVAKDLPEYTIAVGNPARPMRDRRGRAREGPLPPAPAVHPRDEVRDRAARPAPGRRASASPTRARRSPAGTASGDELFEGWWALPPRDAGRRPRRRDRGVPPRP